MIERGNDKSYSWGLRLKNANIVLEGSGETSPEKIKKAYLEK